MALFNPKERFERTAELLQSVEVSLTNLRQDAEAARDLIGTEEADLTETARKVGKVDGLVQTLQKMEAKLVELQERNMGAARIRDGEHDMDAARFEIGCRLARLPACTSSDRLS